MKKKGSTKKGERRRYTSSRRTRAAQATRENVLQAGRSLFSEFGIDKITVREISERAGVSVPTIYALFKSKDGLLQAIMHAALFGDRFRSAQTIMAGLDDPVRMVALTARVSRAIYESEADELGLIRGVSAFSPMLRRIEAEFEAMRYEMQAERLVLLFAQQKQKLGLDLDTARRVMWMYTSRDVFRMLVTDGGWSSERYETWLADALLQALVA